VRKAWLRYGDEPVAGPHEDRVYEVRPATVAGGRRPQQAEPLASAEVDPVNGHERAGPDALQVKAGMIRSSANENVKCGSW
jgi:hypothetical protein